MKNPLEMQQQPEFSPMQAMQMQQQMQGAGPPAPPGGQQNNDAKALYVQGALAAQQQAAMQAMARMVVEPAVAGIRAGGQVGAAQASAAGQQASAETQAAAQIAAAELGLSGTLGAAETRLTGTLAQIKGQLDLQGTKGQQEWAQLIEKLKNEKGIASMQSAAQKAVANIQKTGQVQAAGKSASATIQSAKISKEASRFSAEQGLKGTKRQAEATEFGAKTSAEAQKATAKTQAEAQKDVAQMNILGQLGGGQFGQGIIGAQSAAKQAEALQQIQSQLGIGDFGEGTIRKSQQEQLAREKALAQEQAAQQLGTGDYSGTGGIIGAQSAAKMAEQQAAAESQAALRLGSPYATLGEIAGQGVEQRMTQAQRAQLAQQNMAAHAGILNQQQENIAGKLSGITTPFADMFGLGTNGGGQQRGAGSGLNVPQMIQGAGQGMPQTTAMNLLSGGMGNPYMQPLTGMAGMTGAAGGGPNQLLAMQGAMNAQNQLGLNANQQMAQTAMGAANNLSGQFNQIGATHTQAMQPLASAAGQGLAAIPQAQGAALAMTGNVGASM